jgi:predicted nucleotidyltransferase
MLLENLIGSTTKVKIIRLFYEYPNRSFTTREVIDNTRIGAGYGLRCLNSLEACGLLTMKKSGREKRYRLSTKSEFHHALEEMFSKENNRYPKVSYIHRGIIAEIAEKLNQEEIILFGSVASGTATTDSDIDILVVTARPSEVRRMLREVEKKNGVKIQPVIFSHERLEQYAKKRERILRNISREHIFVRGSKKTRDLIESA